MIKSKFNGYIYFTYLFSLALLILSLYLLFHPHLTLKGRTGHYFPAPIVGLIFLVLTGYLFYVMVKVTYWVSIENGFINMRGIFRKRLIGKSEIKNIDLFSKHDFYLSAGVITVAIKIELVDGEIYIIADPFYKNISTIKQTLSDTFKEKIESFKTNKLRHSTQSDFEGYFEKFSGNPYTSFNGILFLSIIMFIFIILYKQNLKTAHLLVLIPILIFYFGIGSQMHYFIISDKSLIVKNHFWFWRHKEYKIDNIIQANFETQHKRSDALRITTDNFKSRSYSAGSLRRRHWASLRNKLESLGIYFV